MVACQAKHEEKAEGEHGARARLRSLTRRMIVVCLAIGAGLKKGLAD